MVSRTQAPSPPPDAPPVSTPAALAGAPPVGEVIELTPGAWPNLLEALGLLGMVYSIASNCQLVAVDGTALHFVLDESNASLFNTGHSDKIRLALQNYFDRELSVTIDVGQPPGETPAMRTARAARERQAEAVAEIEGDQRLQALMARFDGELDPASIAPMES